MATKDEFAAILDSLPPKPFRSRLEPYAELIMELHRRGRTYREIVRILSEHCDFQTSRSTLNDFVRARSKRPRNMHESELSRAKTRLQNSDLSVKIELPPETRVAPDEIQKRISELKRRTTPVSHSQRFHYDPDKPLSLPPKQKKS
jgi:hypothetical protein